MESTLQSGFILFALLLSLALMLLLLAAILHSRGSEPPWTLDVRFNDFHEAKLEVVLFIVMVCMDATAILLYLS